MQEQFNIIIERDAYSSILYVVLGGLILLSAYHVALFFQNRDKSYLLYSTYTFFAFLAYVPVAESGFIATVAQKLDIGAHSKIIFTAIFNCIYFFFFSHFLGIKKTNISWYRLVVYPAAALLAISVTVFALYKLFGIDVVGIYRDIFVYLITAHTVLSFIILMKVKNKLKYYIIFGGLVLFVCSVIGIHFIRELPFINITRKMGDFIYFGGFFVENIAFSLALGHKQKITADEKVTFQKDLVAELQKNQHLKEQMTLDNEKRIQIQSEQIKYLQEISDLKLSVLQNQMNPHFIFNALNSIKYCIVENETTKAIDYLTKFSKIIRTILVAAKMKEFTLSEELYTLKLYVDIENLRFMDINFMVNVDPKIDQEKVKLPPMALQPFIENAILHGVASIPHKKIELSITEVGNQLKIVITDNGVGRQKAAKIKSPGNNLTKSFGVDIALEMFRNHFGPHDFSVEYTDLFEQGAAAGTSVAINLPNLAKLNKTPKKSTKKSYIRKLN